MIYHIATFKDWSNAVITGKYWPDTNSDEEFIHFSFASQLADVANRIFKGRSELVLLHVNPDLVKDSLRIEAVADSPDKFPHVYRPILIEEVQKITQLEPGSNGKLNFDGLLLS